MKQVITIQVIRPDIEGLTPENRKKLLSALAVDIAEQILFQEELKKKNEEIVFWQQKMIEWRVEDIMNEIKYGHHESK